MIYDDSSVSEQGSIIELFECQVRLNPHKIAVNCGEDNLTYLELSRKANQLAIKLIDEGVRGDSIVGIMAKRSVVMVIAILGVLKAGGAYLPIDPNFPDERKKYLVNDSRIEIILVSKSKSHIRFDSKMRIFDLEAFILDGAEFKLNMLYKPSIKH